MRTLKIALISIVAAYLAAASYMYVFQRDFVFRPSGVASTPADEGLAQVIAGEFIASDGTPLLLWSAAPKSTDLPTVIYFHGNGGNMTERAWRFEQILQKGYGLLAVSYRGYPGSGGAPSEAGFISDGLEIFDALAKKSRPIILHGESLGTGVAIAVAAQRPNVDLVVLEAPYTAISDIAKDQYFWLPVDLMIKDPFLSRERIGNVASPILIVHGTEDRIIPVEHGERLYDLANGPKQLNILNGAGHGNLWKRDLMGLVDTFWRELSASKSQLN